MKDIRITFEDKEFNKIRKVKELSGLGWREWILSLYNQSKYENGGKK